jgi:lipoprotein NlpD
MRVALIAAVVVFAGCSGSLTHYEPRTYVVRPGDTLFKIAWQHGLDQRDLARWNGLTNPNLIRVRQRLRLTPPAVVARSGVSAGRGRPAVPESPAPVLPAPAWVWPTDGRIVARFGGADGIATGIGIAGAVGQPIRAAAGGRVVYAGSGLIGYGQLVIIKHNDTYLSAYGYNRKLLVSQGQEVARGQTIAEMGSGPERQPRLHFEIRRNGAPVDPLRYLATR